jgi:hypothetical protein
MRDSVARLRRRLDLWAPEDTERVASVLQGAGRMAGRLIPEHKTSPAPPPVSGFVTPDGQAHVVYAPPRQTSFGGWVLRYLVGHTVFSLITGAIGVNILLLPFALILWVGGWHVGLPGKAKQEARNFIQRARDAIKEEKEDAAELLEEKKEELSEAVDARKAGLRRAAVRHVFQ